MRKTRRKFTDEFKTKVVLEALQERSTLSELSRKYELSIEIISKWKSEFKSKANSVFGVKTVIDRAQEEKMEQLYAQIGKLKVELDFLKKSCNKLGI